MQNLLQKSRRLNKALQGAAGQPVDFVELAEVLQEISDSDVLVLSRKGKVLGKAIVSGKDVPDFSLDLNKALLEIDSPLVNARGADISAALDWEKVIVVPIDSGGQRLGTLLLTKATEFSDQELLIAENTATVIGMEIMRARVAVVDAESRRRAVVKMALDTLSYSEQEAVEHIFEELNGKEGLLVASRVADRVGITRSVIVNALRKFESAGVIESRSLGMKGTFIKILNDQLPSELEKLKNR